MTTENYLYSNALKLPASLPRDHKVTQYIGKLDKITIFIRSPKYSLAVYWMLLSILWNSKKMMNGLRLSLSQYETPTSHPKTIYQEAYEIRERLLKIRELANHHRLMPLATFLDQIAIDWDDFVEECVLVMDPEIGNLLRRLEDVL